MGNGLFFFKLLKITFLYESIIVNKEFIIFIVSLNYQNIFQKKNLIDFIILDKFLFYKNTMFENGGKGSYKTAMKKWQSPTRWQLARVHTKQE